MKKNSGKNFESLQVDPISGEYYVVIPEWIVNELSWYEDSEISFSLEGTDLVLTEKEEDWQSIDNDVWYLSNHLKLWLKDLQ